MKRVTLEGGEAGPEPLPQMLAAPTQTHDRVPGVLCYVERVEPEDPGEATKKDSGGTETLPAADIRSTIWSSKTPPSPASTARSGSPRKGRW